MNCLFCKSDSSSSRSKEHIVPESLGNRSHVLPPCVVCDKCNNYFATKVEKPLLDSGAFTALRHHQAIPNKRGRIPTLQGILFRDTPVVVRRHVNSSSVVTSLDVDTTTFNRVLAEGRGELIIPAAGNLLDHPIMSRFLAKVAMEALAQRIVDFSGDATYLVRNEELDEIRNHARYGRPKEWPFTMRRIYDDNFKHFDASGEAVQTLFEYDFHLIKTRDIPDGFCGEVYFVLAIFGVEFAINLGGTCVDGYQNWLSQNGGLSPLYTSKKHI